jgi:hypothetical protein
MGNIFVAFARRHELELRRKLHVPLSQRCHFAVPKMVLLFGMCGETGALKGSPLPSKCTE